jgi:hypothetical protein
VSTPARLPRLKPCFTLLESEQPPGGDPARVGWIEPLVENLDLLALQLEQCPQGPDLDLELKSILKGVWSAGRHRTIPDNLGMNHV